MQLSSKSILPTLLVTMEVIWSSRGLGSEEEVIGTVIGCAASRYPMLPGKSTMETPPAGSGCEYMSQEFKKSKTCEHTPHEAIIIDN